MCRVCFLQSIGQYLLWQSKLSFRSPIHTPVKLAGLLLNRRLLKHPLFIVSGRILQYREDVLKVLLATSSWDSPVRIQFGSPRSLIEVTPRRARTAANYFTRHCVYSYGDI